MPFKFKPDSARAPFFPLKKLLCDGVQPGQQYPSVCVCLCLCVIVYLESKIYWGKKRKGTPSSTLTKGEEKQGERYNVQILSIGINYYTFRRRFCTSNVNVTYAKWRRRIDLKRNVYAHNLKSYDDTFVHVLIVYFQSIFSQIPDPKFMVMCLLRLQPA